MTKKIPDKPGGARQKVQVCERGRLVEPGKSKRLAAMRKQTQNPVPPEPILHTSENDVVAVAGLKPEVASELNKARGLISEKIKVIMNSYPPGKQNKLFSFRYGSVDKIKSMPIKAAFKQLDIDNNRVKMKLLAGLDYYGNDDIHDDKEPPAI